MSVPLPFRAPSPCLLFVLTALAFLVVAPFPAHAFEQRAIGDVVVERGRTVPGDVSTAAGDVKILGVAEGDVRSGAGDIFVEGPVKGDVKAGFGNIEIKAPVEGDVETGFGNVYVESVVKGEVEAGHGDVELGPGGKIYYGRAMPSSQEDSSVAGDAMVGVASDREGAAGSRLLGLAGWFFAALAFAALNLFATVVAPRPLSASARRIGESPLWSLALGIGSVPVALVLAVVLAISGVGIPILLLLAPAYFALVVFGALATAYFIGRKVVLATGRYRAGNALAAVVGAFILAAVYLIPLGNLLICALSLLGAGSAILALLSRSRTRPAYSSYTAHVRDRH